MTCNTLQNEVNVSPWSLSRVPWRPDSEPGDPRVRAHEAKVSVAHWQQEFGRPTLSQVQRRQPNAASSRSSQSCATQVLESETSTAEEICHGAESKRKHRARTTVCNAAEGYTSLKVTSWTTREDEAFDHGLDRREASSAANKPYRDEETSKVTEKRATRSLRLDQEARDEPDNAEQGTRKEQSTASLTCKRVIVHR